MKRRILLGVGAGGYGQLVTIAIQLASLPIFLTVWTLDEYGRWVVATTIPSYLALVDFGFNAATQSRLTILVAKPETRLLAQKLFHALFTASLVICLAGVSVSAATLGALPTTWTTAGLGWATFFLIVAAMIAQIGGVFDNAMKATGKYAQSAMLGATSRLVEWIALIIGLMSFGSFFAAGLGALVGRLLATLVVGRIAMASQGIFTLGLERAWVSYLRPVTASAAGNFAFSASSAVALHGPTLIAAAALSPSAAAILTAYRTLFRALVQATSTISHAVWPEFSRLFGEHENNAMFRLYRRSALATGSLSAVAAVLLTFLVPNLLHWWSHGEIPYLAVLAWLMCAYAVAASLWHVPRILLMAINQNATLGVLLLIAAGITVLVAYITVRDLELYGLALAMLAGECASLLSCLYLVRRVRLTLWCNLSKQ